MDRQMTMDVTESKGKSAPKTKSTTARKSGGKPKKSPLRSNLGALSLLRRQPAQGGFGCLRGVVIPTVVITPKKASIRILPETLNLVRRGFDNGYTAPNSPLVDGVVADEEARVYS